MLVLAHKQLAVFQVNEVSIRGCRWEWSSGCPGLSHLTCNRTAGTSPQDENTRGRPMSVWVMMRRCMSLPNGGRDLEVEGRLRWALIM